MFSPSLFIISIVGVDIYIYNTLIFLCMRIYACVCVYVCAPETFSFSSSPVARILCSLDPHLQVNEHGQTQGIIIITYFTNAHKMV